MAGKLIVVCALALLAFPSIAAAQGGPTVGPDRSGMTFELGLGLSITHVRGPGEPATNTGLSGLNLGLGGWISPRTALTVRIAGTSFIDRDIQNIAGVVGVSAQRMIIDNAWVGGGIGIGILTTSGEIDLLAGLGLDLRAGYNFYQSTTNAFNVAVEITPAFFEGLRVTCIGFQVGWQRL